MLTFPSLMFEEQTENLSQKMLSVLSDYSQLYKCIIELDKQSLASLRNDSMLPQCYCLIADCDHEEPSLFGSRRG